MRPKTQDTATLELFQAHFSQILNLEHPLLRLAQGIDWARFETAFADSYCEELGAPGKAIRLMVGLQYLKYAFDESDESLVDRWIENPYWQCFCGFTHMQHEPPIDPSSMSRWRKRVGAERLELLLKETVELAVRTKQLPKRDLAKITIDTTVQEKNITYPTDSKLLTRRDSQAGRGGQRTRHSASAIVPARGQTGRRQSRPLARTPNSSNACARNCASCTPTSGG